MIDFTKSIEAAHFSENELKSTIKPPMLFSTLLLDLYRAIDIKGGYYRPIEAVRGIGVESVENVRVVLRKKIGVGRRGNLRAALQDYGDL